MDLPSMNPVWFGLMMFGRTAWSLPTSTLAKILYMLSRSIIGHQLLSLVWSSDFGMKVITPLFIYAEVSLSLSSTMNV